MRCAVVGLAITMSLVVAACGGASTEDLKAEVEELRTEMALLHREATTSSVAGAPVSTAAPTTAAPTSDSTIVFRFTGLDHSQHWGYAFETGACRRNLPNHYPV